MSGGSISGNAATNSGGGVCMNRGAIEMTGGAISGNGAGSSGGGVSAGTGTLTLSSGNISNNKANSGGGVSTSGNFTMASGTISNNTTINGSGGGVYVSKATFNMSGGLISNNTQNSEMYGGGGLYVTGSTVTISDSAQISGNTSNTTKISDGIAGRQGGGGLYVVKSTVTINGSAQISENTANTANKDYYNGGGGLHVEDKSVVNIEGNAKISGNIAVMNGGGFFVNDYSTVTIGGNAKVSGNQTPGGSSGAGGAVFLYPQMYSTFNMDGSAEISGNTASYNAGLHDGNGAAIDVQPTNTFNLKGGTIKNNDGISTVCVRSGGTVSIASNVIAGSAKDGTDATLVENLTLTTSNYGDYNYFSFGQSTKPDQTIKADNVIATYGDTGVKITASVTNPASGGGALSYAVKDGSDVVQVDASGNLTLLKAGTAIVTVKAAETETHAETTKDVTVTVNRADPNLSYATATVSKQMGDTVFTNDLTNPKSVAVTYTSDNTDVATVDASTGEVTIVAAGSAKITAGFGGDECYNAGSASYTLTVNSPKQVTFNANGGIGTMEPQYFTEAEQKLSKNKFTKENYLFQGWATDANATTATYTDEQPVTITADTTLYAVWKLDDTQYAINIVDKPSIVTVKIEKAENANGTFEEVTTAKYGDTVRITVEVERKENFNARCKPLEVTDSTGATVETTQESETDNRKIVVYTFTMPARPVNVKASYEVSIPINRVEIEAADVTCTYGDTDAKVDATAIGCTITGYAVKEGYGDYIDVDGNTGALTIKKAGTAYVVVTANVAAISGGSMTSSSNLTKDVKVTINKADPTVTAPTEKELTYNGEAQALVNAGSTEDGELQYALGESADSAPTGGWAKDIPTGTNAGTYYVWYKVVGDDNHSDSEPACIPVTIKNAASGRSATPADALVYSGVEQALVKGGSVEGGTLMYAVTTEPTQPALDAYSEAIPTASEPGTYYVWYYVKGDKNHNDTEPAMLTVVISPQPAADEPETSNEPETSAEPSYLILAKLSTSGKKALKVSWTKVPGAEGFDVYFAHCGQPLQQVGSVGGSTYSYTVKGLNKYDAYKGFVRAWKTVNGAKVTIGESPLVHAITGGKTNKYVNPKKVIVKKSKVKLAVGKTSKIKASVTKVARNRKLLDHESKLRYYSNNPAVATVSASGKITAVGAGSCKIYAVAVNGARAAVKVTVK